MTIRGVTWRLKVFWAMVVLGHGFFLLMSVDAYRGSLSDGFQPSRPYASAASWVSFGILGLIPWAYWQRNQRYKAHWRGDLVTPEGYVQGMSVVLAATFLSASFSYFSVQASQNLVLGAVPILISLGVHLMNYPTGRPMQPVTPRLGTATP